MALAATFWVLSAASAAGAAESEPARSPRATVSLVSELSAVAPGERVRLGLWQRLSPHWHTYWRNPGDAGTPPELALTLPEGAQAGEIVWPGPQRLPAGPVVSFGYEQAVLLPVEVSVPASARVGEPFVVQAEASWLVCKQDCVPEEGRFRLELPVVAEGTPVAERAVAGEVADAFRQAERRAPTELPGPSRFVAEGEALTLRVEGLPASPEPMGAFFFPGAWGAVTHAAPQTASFEGGALTLAMQQGPAFDPAAPIEGVLALHDEAGETRWYAVDAASVQAPPAVAGPAAGERGESTTPAALPLWKTVLFALLGGLLLNLMPCVFPVLAIKAHALVRMGGDDRAGVRRESLWYTLGVLAAFLGLSALLFGLRAAGAEVGWGFQFQSPRFVAAMAWLLLALGLSLSGVYALGLGLSGAGSRLAERPGRVGSFFTGLLAVVVATPCTAPFMGAALGAALLAPVATGLSIFVAMGVGLALPYALLGVFPDLARALPRPGAWMLRLQQALAFLLYGSTAWLLWVLARQAGEGGLRVALAGCVLVGLACWLLGVAQALRGRRFRAWLPAALAAVAVLWLWTTLHASPAAAPQGAEPSGESVAFTPARLAALRAEGTPVFVNLTADWCLTCLVNERTTLGTPEVQEAMREAGVAYLEGDWTRRDPAITALLHEFERDGVPFYAVYPRGGGAPEVLPSVLTVDGVRAALERASHP